MILSVGKHVLVDLHGCDKELLKKVDYISDIMYEAAKISEANVVGKFFKQFDPWGVSGVIVISESHISIHTWPEYGIAAIDYFSCSEEPKIDLAINYLKEKLKSKSQEDISVTRGHLNFKEKIKEEIMYL